MGKESLRVDYPRLDDGQLYDLAKIYITHQDEVQAGLAEEAKRVDESLLKALPSCPALPPAPEPTNVRQLKPQNVGVVAAIGDSISCGSNAESTTWLNLKQYRGLASSVSPPAPVTRTSGATRRSAVRSCRTCRARLTS